MDKDIIASAELIDLNEYIKAGEGANGESYNHKTDDSLMIKLYSPHSDMDAAWKECDIARKVYDAGIPSPEPGCFITDGNGRFGIKFRRLTDKVSYARAIGNHPEQVETLSREFARMCKKLHSTDVGTQLFPNAKDVFGALLDTDPRYDAGEKAVIRQIIDSTPDATTALHGDLQVGNALISGGKSYFIDLGEFAYGHPYFDLGMTIVIGVYNDAFFTMDAMHMHKSTAIQSWEYFVDEYFDGTKTLLQAEQELLPYAVVKTLLIEHNAGCIIPNLHSLIKLL